MTKDLGEYIPRTYFALRAGLAAIAFGFPIALWIGGHLIAGLDLQKSMSTYYHAGNGALRDLFVGTLCAIAAILFLYQGVTRLEDYALNLAALFALGIAMFPTASAAGTGDWRANLHVVCAVAFFICIGYVAIFRSGDTLSLLPEDRQKMYRRFYLVTGWAMVLLPAAAFATRYIPALANYNTFFIEAAGIYAFGAYWVIKTRELSETNFEKKAANRELAVPEHGVGDAMRRVPVQRAR
jgi:hypothetical protein